MKIAKSKIRKLIQEELTSLVEVEYDEGGNPMYYEPKGDERSPEKAEVLVQGYGGLRIDQIRRRLQEMRKEIAEDETLATLHFYLRRGVMEAFVKTLVAHNALGPPTE